MLCKIIYIKATTSQKLQVFSKLSLKLLGKQHCSSIAPKQDKCIKILFNSQAASKSLCSKDIETEMAWRTVEELSKLSFEIPRLTLTWIKAHVGHEGNKMAKQGVLETDMSKKVDIPNSKTEISTRLNNANIQ